MKNKEISLIKGFICLFMITIACLICKEVRPVQFKNKTYVVIGASAAGRSAVKELTREASSSDRIIFISKEESYDKTELKKYIKKNHLPLLSPVKQKNAPIEVVSATVMHIDRNNKEVICEDGLRIAYDCLFLGIGTEPIIPVIAGIDEVEGVFGYHTLDDARAIKQYMQSHSIKSIAVMGGGLASLEITANLAKKGYVVHHCVRGPRILRDKADNGGAQYLQNIFSKNNVQWHFNSEVTRINSINCSIKGIILNNKDEIAVDMMIYAIGSNVNTHLVDELILNKGGFSVDHYMCTSDPYIYTGGDAACVWDYVNQSYVRGGKWSLAKEQGCCAAKNMCGKKTPYKGVACVNFAQYFKTLVAFSGPIDNPPHDYTCATKMHKSLLLRITDSFLETKNGGYRIFLEKSVN